MIVPKLARTVVSCVVGRLARRRLENGDLESAIAGFSLGIHLSPKRAPLYFNRGCAYLLKHETGRAIEDFSAAIRLDPKDAAAFAKRAMAHGDHGEYQNAIADFTEAIRLDPQNAEHHANRAVAFRAEGRLDNAVAGLSEAIRLMPTLAVAYVLRAAVHADKGNLETAIADLDWAIQLAPNSPCYFEVRAAMRFRRGEYDRGMTDIQSTLELNAMDSAATFEAWPKYQLSSDDLKHGWQQVIRMLGERPAMDQFGQQATVLHEWASRKFAGEDAHLRVYWDGVDPFSGGAAEHTLPSRRERAAIRVRANHSDGPDEGKGRPFETLWSEVVFELYNVANAQDFRRLLTELRAGTLSRDQFISRVGEIEERAAEKMRSFCIHVFLPWAREHGHIIDPALWSLGTRLRPSDPLGLVTTNNTYWRYNASAFDAFNLRSMIEKRDSLAARELAAKMVEQPTANNDERARLFHFRGWAYAAAGETAKAIADFTEAIRLRPGHTEALRYRAAAYKKLQKFRLAIADHDDVIRLAPTDARGYAARARAKLSMGRYDEAIADFTEAIRLAPRDARAYYGRGFVYLKKGDRREAETNFAEAARVRANRFPRY